MKLGVWLEYWKKANMGVFQDKEELNDMNVLDERRNRRYEIIKAENGGCFIKIKM